MQQRITPVFFGKQTDMDKSVLNKNKDPLLGNIIHVQQLNVSMHDIIRNTNIIFYTSEYYNINTLLRVFDISNSYTISLLCNIQKPRNKRNYLSKHLISHTPLSC